MRQLAQRAVPEHSRMPRQDDRSKPVTSVARASGPDLAEARNLGNSYLGLLDFVDSTATCAAEPESRTATEGPPTCAARAFSLACAGGCGGCGMRDDRTDQTVNAGLSTITPSEEDDGGAETYTQATGSDAGTSCSPTSARFTRIPSSRLTPSFSGGRFGAAFNMDAEFETPIPCTCVSGEYRQFVRGYFKRNGATVTHRLCGTNLSPASWQEDCSTVGGTDFKYGYHAIPFPTSRFTNPDQATGCTFNGFDHPGFSLAGVSPGDVLELHLEFEGKLVDASAGDRVLRSSSWSVEGTGTAP